MPKYRLQVSNSATATKQLVYNMPMDKQTRTGTVAPAAIFTTANDHAAHDLCPGSAQERIEMKIAYPPGLLSKANHGKGQWCGWH